MNFHDMIKTIGVKDEKCFREVWGDNGDYVCLFPINSADDPSLAIFHHNEGPSGTFHPWHVCYSDILAEDWRPFRIKPKKTSTSPVPGKATIQ